VWPVIPLQFVIHALLLNMYCLTGLASLLALRYISKIAIINVKHVYILANSVHQQLFVCPAKQICTYLEVLVFQTVYIHYTQILQKIHVRNVRLLALLVLMRAQYAEIALPVTQF
jgi:hypothetical protein